MSQYIPIPTLHLFPKLDALLIDLLRSLSNDDWSKPTLAKAWTVKDVAAHLLDGNLRSISMLRDNYFGDRPQNITSYQDLVTYLNNLNAHWVKAMKRLSPNTLVDLLENTGKDYYECLATLDPFDTALFSVAWAGEERSLNWFHTAREYTEKWHHQQQIREAVEQEGIIMTPELFYPCLDTFMQALPYAYQGLEARAGSTLKITVTGEAGGEWYLTRDKQAWLLSKQNHGTVISEAMISATTVWKMFTKALNKDVGLSQIMVKGETGLGTHLVNAIAVMA